MPPNSVASMNSGRLAASITNRSSRLAKSLPSTSSELLRRVISSRIRVRRSFSCATAPATPKAARKITSASWNGARIWNRTDPKRAMSPTVRMI